MRASYETHETEALMFLIFIQIALFFIALISLVIGQALYRATRAIWSHSPEKFSGHCILFAGSGGGGPPWIARSSGLARFVLLSASFFGVFSISCPCLAGCSCLETII